MKILFDNQSFLMQTFGGISRYYSEIYQNLSKNSQISTSLPLVFTENEYIKNEIQQKLSKKFPIANFLLKNNIFKRKVKRYLRKTNRKQMIDALKNQDFDVFIPTYYDPYFLEHIQNKPFVLTVYDMIHEIYPQYFETDDKTSDYKKILIPKAHKIIAVSENTKKDILHFFPAINPSKIEVVYHGFSQNTHSKLKNKLPERYVLYMGARPAYKNFEFFLKAFLQLSKEDNELKIVAAGGGKLSKNDVFIIESYNLTEKIIHYRFEEKELDALYQNAQCFVFPSEYEGFGIPVLEAMANGCPIVLPYQSSFPEVAGDAGIYFETNNLEDLIEKLKTVLYNVDFKDIFIEKGKIQAAKFTWGAAANHCLEVYKKAK